MSKMSTHQPASETNPETTYLAADLEIVSRRNLDAFKGEVRNKASVNRDEKIRRGRVVLLSIGARRLPKETPDRALNKDVMAQVRFVRGLSAAARAEWDAAITKTVDIGIQSGGAPSAYELRLDAKTIQAVAEIGAHIQVTVYGATPPHDHDHV